MRITTEGMFRSGIAAMLTQQAHAARAQQQLSSGQRLTQAADDPVGYAQVLRIDSSLSAIARFGETAILANHRIRAEEQSLGDVTQFLQRAHELTIQANTGILSDADRAAIDAELAQLESSLLAAANRDDGSGNALFAGTSGNATPFALVAGTVAYGGNSGVRQLDVGDGVAIADGDPGDAVFMNVAGGASLFERVAAARAALASPAATRSADLGAALTGLAEGIEHVTTLRAATGARMNSLDVAENQNEATALQLRTQRSALADTDYVEAASRLSLHLTALEAAQQSFMKVQSLSLFQLLR